MSDAGTAFRGFIVHTYTDMRRGRLYCVGRLDDGRSFAAVERRWRPRVHIFQSDVPRAKKLLSSLRPQFAETDLRPFSGNEPLAAVICPRYADRSAAASILAEAGIPSPDADIKPQDLFLMEKHIRLCVEIRGACRQGRRVDCVFVDPELTAAAFFAPPLRVASVDIETDTRTNSVRAVSVAWDCESVVRTAGENVDTEQDLLAAFLDDIRHIDPDVITGWNFLDFDCKILAERCAALGVPFTLGRGGEEAKYFTADNRPSQSQPWRNRRSAAALVPGRQVIDALRIVRSGARGVVGFDSDDAGFFDYSLETVAQKILGEGKSQTFASPEDKIKALDELYAADKKTFGEYCRRDAELVLRILDKTGLFALTVERAGRTGVTLDKAWTSVVSFERIYGTELLRRRIAPPPAAVRKVSGAAGGTIIEPAPGLFKNIAVFDFRSLYPSIMRTFNIDPWAHAQALANANADAADTGRITAPNGAAFMRGEGILPLIITEYFAERRRALDAGNVVAAQVYKILMNSFYGVLGTSSCRYARTELAGSITSFARTWLHFSRDWFTARGMRVLYGDTDSLFVETGLTDGDGYDQFETFCGGLARELTSALAQKIKDEYDLESFLELRFEKAYRRFLLPRVRSAYHGRDHEREARGRAKGYGGSVIGKDGGTAVEVKGMEAVRSDSTPLARRLQMELLQLVFDGDAAGAPVESLLMEHVRRVLAELERGEHDGELVYRKRLSRPPESYTASTPPQVKAARLLGWKGRRGTVQYVWTKNGAEPDTMPHAAIDYEHYAQTQVLSVAYSIADAAGFAAEALLPGRAGVLTGGQRELEFDNATFCVL